VRRVRFVAGFELEEILMLTASIVLIGALERNLSLPGLSPTVLGRRSGFVADFREVTHLSSLGLIFLRHPPEFVGDVSARRYPRVTGAHPRQLD
jgi:hypothetical protein